MTKKRSNYNSSRRPEREPKEERYVAFYEGYLSYPMTANDEKAYEKLVWSDFDMDAWLQEQVENGYRLVVGYRKDGDAITAELQDIDTHSDFYGFRLSAGSDTVIEALRTLVYKHTVALKQDWIHCPQPQERETKKRW